MVSFSRSSRFAAVPDSDDYASDGAPPVASDSDSSERPPSYRAKASTSGRYVSIHKPSSVASNSDSESDAGRRPRGAGSSSAVLLETGRMSKSSGAASSPARATDESASDSDEGRGLIHEKNLGKGPSTNPEGDAMDRFEEEIAATRKDLATLHAKFNTIRALSARLSVLPLTDFSVPTLALELRSALQNASQRLTDLDGEIQLHWDDENEVGVAMATGQIRLTPMEVYTRRHLYDEVAAKFRQRVKDIQREAKGEERERKERAQERPEELDDWLAASRRDLKNLSRRDTQLPSRYVVQNPFSILAQMTAGMKSLTVANMLPRAKKPFPRLIPPPVVFAGAHPETEGEAMDEFYDKILETQKDVDTLNLLFADIRSLHTQLISQPVDVPCPAKLSNKLQTLLSSTALLLVEADEKVQSHWVAERRGAAFGKTGRITFTPEDVYERRQEYDAVASRLLKRVREVQREARGEMRARRRLGVRSKRDGLATYLSGGPGSDSLRQFVANNPFTALAFDLNVKAEHPLIDVSSDSEPTVSPVGTKFSPTTNPARTKNRLAPSYRRAPSSKKHSRRSIPANPTPLGLDPTPRPYSWKLFPVKPKYKRNDLEGGWDEIEKEAREMRAYARYGNRERWIVFLTLALIPALLAGFFIDAGVETGGSEVLSTAGATLMSEGSGRTASPITN